MGWRSGVLTAFLTCSAFAASANTCDGKYWPGPLQEHEPNAIALPELEAHLNQLSVAEGIGFDIELKDDGLWIDVTEYPGNVTLAAASRVLFIIGRITDGQFGSMVLSDNGKGVFRISEPDIRAIGCQFVWSVPNHGENPIVLVREFADALTYYDTGGRVALPYNGSPLGDTQKALSVLNDALVPKWVLKTVVIK